MQKTIMYPASLPSNPMNENASPAFAEYVKDFDSTEDIAFALMGYAYDGIDLFEDPEIIEGGTFDYVSGLLEDAFKDEYFVLSAVKPVADR